MFKFSGIFIIAQVSDITKVFENLLIEPTIHNVISSKIIIRKFLKYFREKYRWRKKYWLYFSIKKDFHLNIEKDFQELLKNNK